MQSSRTLTRFDCPKRGKFFDEDLTAGERLELFLDSAAEQNVQLYNAI